MIKARYWLIKYIEDPLRNEPRNVGIIVKIDNNKYIKFLGENEDLSIDDSLLPKKLNKNVDNYKQWIAYYRDISLEELEKISDDISMRTSFILEGPGNRYEYESITDEQMVNDLFDKLVSVRD